ncbi:T9SS type A sorting domain-containing protein [Chryseobacterium sp. MDT2-18]|uniref:Ig-like domain-containing protein n=1 Tax=Chryseobacterium sp. MDT2-18 TaxID=1259136 RepID=UPI00278205F8|nr:T9SS type A sorting domain-containing protein [Chryseobacterium sp. MDT2-18]MDQ0476860.1 hypothetical protein [Chryseobacterium sp. MDT2-18]
MMKKFTSWGACLLMFFLLAFQTFNAQVKGDYKSAGTGNWTSLSSWLYYDGSGWATPGSTVGYPGEKTNPLTKTVTILAPHTITVSSALSVSIGDLYVEGKLVLMNNFTLNTRTPYPNLIINDGTIYFAKNAEFTLPSGANISISIADSKTQGLQMVDPNDNTACTGQTGISIGNKKFSMCQGAGTAGTFGQVNEAAASGIAVANADETQICAGGSVKLIGSKIGSALAKDKTIKWVQITGPTVSMPPTPQKFPSEINVGPLSAGTYAFEFSFMIGNNTFTDNITISVNPTSVVGTVSANQSICSGTAATISLSGNVGTIQWQQSADGSTWTNVTGGSGGTTNSYTTPNLTATTYYRALVKSGACSSATTSSVTVNVNPASVAGTVSASPSICSGTAATISLTGSVGTIQWQQSADGISNWTNVTGGSGGTTNSYTTPNLTGNIFYRAVVTSGLCPFANSLPIKVTVSPISTVSLTSVPATNNQILCSSAAVAITPITFSTMGASGIGTPTNLPTGVSAAWSGNTITISGTPTESGTFKYSIPLTGGCGTVNAIGTITINDGAPTTFSGTWSNGLPDISKKAIFATSAAITSGNNMTACSCEIQPGATLIINANAALTVQNNIVNEGQLIVESDGNLIQRNNTATYTSAAGKSITVKRNASMRRLDYTYWGSPVSGQKLKTFSAGTLNNRFLTYNESNDIFVEIDPVANNFADNGKGYAIRAANTYTVTPQVFGGTFVGKPHNGIISYPLQKLGQGFNLVGNPYASNIDFNKLANAGTIVGKAYFWTNVNENPPMEGGAYSGANYATYTVGSGGVPSLNGGPEKKPDQFIKVGQGFIVQAKANNTQLVFNNDMRNDGSGASKFMNRNAANNDHQIDRFWLKLTTPAGNFNTILLAYPEGSTNDYQADYDAEQLGASSDSFYSVLNELSLIIQGRRFPLERADRVPLGMKGVDAGSYTMETVEKEGSFANGQHIYLKDKQTGTLTNLSENSYTFTANKGVTEGRFEIVYLPETVLVTDNKVKEGVVVYRDGSDFVVKAQSEKITALEVYDGAGRIIFSVKPNNVQVTIPADKMVKGLYVFKIAQSGEVTTRKVMP